MSKHSELTPYCCAKTLPNDLPKFAINLFIVTLLALFLIEAKGYLQSGEAANASQAVKMAGISCSAYYKYKDKIFEYSEQGDDATTINAKLQDNAGVLSSVMNELYLAGANILVVNQSKQNKKEFLRGYDYMLSKIEPESIICFGTPFDEMRGNIIPVDYRSSMKMVR